MKIYDRVVGNDSQIKRDISVVKQRLHDIQPQLQSLHDPEIMQRADVPRVTNRGLFEIRIDLDAVVAVLTGCGVRKDDLSNISIVFRAAKLADRNFTGQIAAGIRFDAQNGGHVIEVYTSLPHLTTSSIETTTALESTKTINFAFNKEQLAITLLEELRHVVQAKLNLFDLSMGSFEAEGVDELRKIDFEADAEAFTQALGREFAKFISIEPYENSDLAEMYDTDVSADDYVPKGLQKFLDLDLIATVRDTDPVGLYLLQDLRSVAPLDSQAVSDIVTKTLRAVEGRELGFVEARWILTQLKEKVVAAGNVIAALDIDAQIRYLS